MTNLENFKEASMKAAYGEDSKENKNKKNAVPLKCCISKFSFNLKKLNTKEKYLLERFLVKG